MSTTEHMTRETERAERPVLHRVYEATAIEVEGRTVDVRVVPFGEIARVADPPDWTEYQEQWMPGCFDHQLNAANRIHANYEHMEGPANIVGHGITLRQERDGYHITAKIHESNAGDATLNLLRDGALPSVSLEARPVRNVRTETGVMQRVKAHLRGFAFCRQGAFAGAQVLAVRHEDDDEDEVTVNAAPSYDMDPELVERLRAHGAWLPDRYQAHPAETGTPDESGTPEDGTRRPEETADTPEEQRS